MLQRLPRGEAQFTDDANRSCGEGGARISAARSLLPAYSGLIPAALAICVQRTASDFMNAENSSAPA